MRLEDILTLSKAGFTAQQIAAMERPQTVPQMVQPQTVQNYPQMAHPQMVLPQMVQPQTVQMPQTQPQVQQYQPVLPTQQAQQPQVQQYQPVLPTQQNTDPLQGVMLQNYANPNNMNMYDVHNVVADMIGANAPIQTEGGKK